MTNISFKTFEEIETNLGFIQPDDFFNTINNYNITIRNILFNNKVTEKLDRQMKGCEFKEIIEGLKTEYENPYIEVIKNDIDNELVVILDLFDTYENEEVKYEWLIVEL